ncbi:MAG: collagen-like protein [Myxococcaceae bacterium]|nr:collagen-like protein [Myxococcaceae bacterium]
MRVQNIVIATALLVAACSKSVEGPAGPTGETGAQGVKGERGAKGDQGDRGEKGDVGARGEAGLQGERGERGERGDIGPQGIQGLVGPQGLQGLVGPQGLTGEQGLQGIAGAVGATGAQGLQGLQGLTGATGATGAQGIQGVAGAVGAAGVSVLGTPEPAGANCAAGGIKYTSADGTHYVCNGLTGSSGSSGPVVRDALGQLLGTLVSSGPTNAPARELTFLTSAGYTVTLNQFDSTPPHAYNVWYSGLSCTGTPYLQGSANKAIWQKASTKTAYYLGKSSQWAVVKDSGVILPTGYNSGTTVVVTASGYNQGDSPSCATGSLPGSTWAHELVTVTQLSLGLPLLITHPLSISQ